MNRKFWAIVLFGLFLRLVLMPITLHPDTWAISFSEYLFAYKGVFNIYEYLKSLPDSSSLVQNYGRNFFTYPPLAYFTFGFFGLLLKPFYDLSFFSSLADNLPLVLADSRLSWHLFLTKLPYLFFDFSTVLILAKLFTEKKRKTVVCLLWLVNPLSVYTSFMVGQFDIIPVFWLVLSLYFVGKSRPGFAALALGVGGAYKMFPLLLLPFMAVYSGRAFKQVVKLILLGLAPLGLTMAPFLSSSAFRQTVLLSNQSQKMLFAKVAVSGAEYLSLFVVVYIFLLLFSGQIKKGLWVYYLAVLLTFFSLTHYHPQWFLWLTPLLVIAWVKFPKLKVWGLLMVGLWLIITLFFEPSLSLGLFSPLFGQNYAGLGLFTWLSRYYDVPLFLSLVRSVFAGMAVFVLGVIFRDQTKSSHA